MLKLSVIMLNVFYDECHNKVYYAECHYAECHYAECRGAKMVECLSLAAIFRNV
jgi:hypothetical protein